MVSTLNDDPDPWSVARHHPTESFLCDFKSLAFTMRGCPPFQCRDGMSFLRRNITFSARLRAMNMPGRASLSSCGGRLVAVCCDSSKAFLATCPKSSHLLGASAVLGLAATGRAPVFPTGASRPRQPWRRASCCRGHFHFGRPPTAAVSFLSAYR